MKRERYLLAGFILSLLLLFIAFTAKDYMFYAYPLSVSDYQYKQTEERPVQAQTPFWFSFGNGAELFYGHTEMVSKDTVRLFASTEQGAAEITEKDLQPIRSDLTGYFAAVLPERKEDLNGDGREETVCDFARADMGPETFGLLPRSFGKSEIAFEAALEERKRLQVHYLQEPLKNGEVTVTNADGQSRQYVTDEQGFIKRLSTRDIRRGVTVSYQPDQDRVYRMYYVLEDYPYFSEHFRKAYIPLGIMLLSSALLILVCQLVRTGWEKKTKKYAGVGSMGGFSLRGNRFYRQTGTKMIAIRWITMVAAMFFWTYGGKLIGEGQKLNHVAVPFFTCPFNLDQVFEAPCYYMSHLPALFMRNSGYILWFFATLFFCLAFLGRILCGFLCPLGLVQDIMDKIRQCLHIRPVTIDERRNQIFQPLKWIWTILFVGFVFAGGDFCDICPARVFSSSMGGWWINYAVTGFLTVFMLVGSFFIRRFWCLMCPLGFLMGFLKRFNLFRLKKDCTACTGCGACYEACPMRIKSIYTEREQTDIQTVDCLMCGECIHKCPEDDAISMTFCGKKMVRSSRKGFMKKYRTKKI